MFHHFVDLSKLPRPCGAILIAIIVVEVNFGRITEAFLVSVWNS